MKTYKFQRQRLESNLNFEVVDTMGIEHSGGGLLMGDIENILDGHIADGYKVRQY